MSRIKNMPRLGWFIAGVAITMLLVPSVAVAAGLKFTGIEGSDGTTATLNKAEVTAAGQIEVAPTDASSIFQNGYSVISAGYSYAQAATPPSGHALIIDTVHIGIFSYGSGVSLYLQVEDAINCSASNAEVGTYDQYIATTGDGDIDVPLSPGVVVPSGDSLCLVTYGSLEATVSASGYTIPAAAATNEPVHRVVPTAVPTPSP